MFSPLKWVLTGPPRSGTTRTADWLTANGLPTSHERAFNNPTTSEPVLYRCRLPGDSSWAATPYTPQLRAAGVFVIKLVRPVTDVARSLERVGFDPADSVITSAVRLWCPQVLTAPDRYVAFVDAWYQLIDSDTEWDITELGVSQLQWLRDRL